MHSTFAAWTVTDLGDPPRARSAGRSVRLIAVALLLRGVPGQNRSRFSAKGLSLFLARASANESVATVLMWLHS